VNELDDRAASAAALLAASRTEPKSISIRKGLAARA
jgi:hypothetical protein